MEIVLNLQDSKEGNETYGNNPNENKKAWYDASKMLWQLKEVRMLVLLPRVSSMVRMLHKFSEMRGRSISLRFYNGQKVGGKSFSLKQYFRHKL